MDTNTNTINDLNNEISDLKCHIDNLYKLLICHDSSMLKHLDSKQQTDELCKLAITKDYKSLQYVINQTEELCKLAINQNIQAFAYINDKCKTYNLCKLVVQIDGLMLKHIIKPSYDLCEIAVKNNGLALEFVPENILTINLCKTAVFNRPLSLKYVPESMQTDELCDVAIQIDAFAILCVKDPTDEQYFEAIKRNMDVLPYIKNISYNLECMIMSLKFKKLFFNH